MCGIAGYLAPSGRATAEAERALRFMNEVQRHRGPDGEGVWLSPDGRVGFAHRRLAIIDLSTGDQPMTSESGNVIVYNGEIYNYLELREELGPAQFKTASDTEVILRAYERWGADCVRRLRGMFAFVLWDAARGEFFVARDRFGIKPLHYIVSHGRFIFASEMKTLVPFLPEIAIDPAGLHDYFSFQFCLDGRTLFSGVRQFPPAHWAYVGDALEVAPKRYWEVQYRLDWEHTEKYFIDRLDTVLRQSVDMHLRSDVEVASYASGGLDSSLIAVLARAERRNGRFQLFHGRFGADPGFDESPYAQALAAEQQMDLHIADIVERDFVDHIGQVIYHLDEPVAGPGSFPQYLVSRLVRENGVKVVLGGQGGDEVFGGYARYLIAYWEQCIKGALEGTIHSGNFVVTYESIIPNLQTLRDYKPLIQEFWSEGLFGPPDERYFRLINRSNTFREAVDWGMFDRDTTMQSFKAVFWGQNVGKESYFDSMTHFDFKTLLPALLQVEDRMSMAHGIESRVPFLDDAVVEFAATVPANVKFAGGELKRLLRRTFADRLPRAIRERKDKMGFPVPLALWLRQKGPAREFVMDLLSSGRARQRPYLAKGFDLTPLVNTGSVFSRNLWAFLSLELWQRQFHDRAAELHYRPS
ncbi:MAG TPA: asparagine synthase (glutamine-hydrolyzing) [Stellaceae bacterium]|nr:asparagine synthase (glutamine-hydrolyzing) [Stellaceae bacterium]